MRGRGFRPRRLLGWALILALLLAPGLLWPDPPGEAARSPLHRLLGPVAELASHVQWIRFQRARLAGRQELAIARAESALQLAPEQASGWEYLAHHFAHFLSSPERERNPERRLRWFRAGIEVTRRGQLRVERPGDLAFHRGLLFSSKAFVDPELPWPGGVRGLWEEAAAAFEEAAELLDDPGAAELARLARERAGE